MTKAKKMKRNSGEAVEVGDPGPGCSESPTVSRKIPVEHRSDDYDSEEEMYNNIKEDDEGGMRIGDIYIAPPPKPALTFDATGPRMIITHIVNENFKSYAGTQYLGPFHKSFTSIIGPNGSGKSNVIDSMLFVFGYRASKIRSKKISVLIHSSSKYPNLQSATVAVHFSRIVDDDGEEGYKIVPNSSIVVSRTAFRDSSSHYMLDGKRAQFKDVAVVLRDYGIDLDHNRFLILQGEVEQIAMMKPKASTEHDFGMLEYLEDIIGTSRYKAPIAKIAARVEHLTESRKQKLNRVRMVEAEKTKLEQPMREAVELMNLTNQALRTRNMMLQKYGHEVGKLIETRKEAKAAIEAKLAVINEKHSDVMKVLEEKTALEKEEAKKFHVLNKKKQSLAERLQLCQKKTLTMTSDVSQLNKKKKNLDQLIEQDKGKLIELELIPEKHTKEIAECEKLIQKHNEIKLKTAEELKAVYVGVKEKTEGLQRTKGQLDPKLMKLKAIVSKANDIFKKAESELHLYINQEKVETEKLTQMKESYEKAKKDYEENKRIKEEVSATLPDRERELAQIQSQLPNIRREEATVLKECSSLVTEVEQCRQAMSDTASRNAVLSTLLREKKNGRFPGIYGRLGDLGGIDMKYDVAISTCCGALENIVTDTAETSQRCVEYLKEIGRGRCTFIALNKIEHLKKSYERRQNYPEGVPRMFDLITVKDPRVMPAFYFALRDTLVANDLEQATRIAYGATRYRTVSLKGDVIEIAGTMSGGGKSVMRGRMASSVKQDTSKEDPSVVKKNEKKLAALQQRLSELRSQVANMEDTMSTLQRSVENDKKVLKKASVYVENLTTQVSGLQAEIKKQESRVMSCKLDEGKKAKLESVVAEASERLDKANQDSGEVQKEVNEVVAQIQALSGGRADELKKKVDGLTKKIQKINTEITKLKLDITGNDRNMKLLKDKISQMEVDVTETVKRLEDISVSKKQHTLESAELTKEIEEIEEQINEGSGEYTTLKKEIAKLDVKQNKIKSERMVVTNELNAEEKAIEDCQAKLPVWRKEIAELKLEDAGEDETGIPIPDLEAPAPLETHTAEELDATNVDELRAKYNMLKQRIGDAKPNTGAIKDYRAKEAAYLERAAVLEGVTTRRNELRASYDIVRKKRQTDFLAGFNVITAKLKEMYQMITLGGDAELELVDSLDPFTEGIIFSVRPPNKSWKNISNLSGGEKTLSSLALVFALHYYRPTPLYVMDEIDAALDFKNVSIVANYIKDRTRNAQFVIISLRYIMFETSNRLVGIYKVRDCTYSVAVENEPILTEPTKSRDKIV